MFNFLNSAVLLAAAAALIPLLIHLFSRRRVQVVEFSSIRHLKQMQKRQVRRIKIRQLLLLLLRMLIVLAAVLAFARPATRGGYIGSHAGVSAVILLDRSASMQRQVKDGRLFDLAKKKAEEVLSNFGEADELILIPFDRQAAFPAGERFFSRDIAEDVLAEVTTGYETGDLADAYNKAVELLGSAKNLNKELYIISDRQAGSLPESVDSTAGDITVYVVDLPLETDGNCGVINVDLGDQLIEVGVDFTVRAETQNYDNRTKSELLASLFVDGTRVMQSEFKLDAMGRESVTFKHAVHSPGYHSGRIEIADDGFAPDNRSYFSFYIPDRFTVMIVDGDGGGALIRLALVPSDEVARSWTVKTVTPEQFTSVSMHDYDAIILSGITSLGITETSQLLHYVDNGGGLLFILGGRTEPEYYNRYFSEYFDIRLTAPPPTSFSGAGYYSVNRFDFTHPIFKAFTPFGTDDGPTLKYYALPKIEDGQGNRDLCFFTNNAPALVEVEHGLGRMAMLTAPIIPRYSDISGHSFFVPLMIRTIEYLAGTASAYEMENYVGKNVMRSISGRDIGFGTVDLITPGNQSYAITGVEESGQMQFDCRPVDIPGIYQLLYGGRRVDLFPVNVAAIESDLGATDIDRLASALGLDDIRTIPYETATASIIGQARFGRELWKIFLWIAIVIMAVEMLLSREGEIKPEES